MRNHVTNPICMSEGHTASVDHVIPNSSGMRAGMTYFRQQLFATDGMGTVHVSLHTTCARCSQDYQVGLIHLVTKEQILRWAQTAGIQGREVAADGKLRS